MRDAPVFHDETLGCFQFLLIIVYDMRTCLFLCSYLWISFFFFNLYECKVCVYVLFFHLVAALSWPIFVFFPRQIVKSNVHKKSKMNIYISIFSRTQTPSQTVAANQVAKLRTMTSKTPPDLQEKLENMDDLVEDIKATCADPFANARGNILLDLENDAL